MKKVISGFLVFAILFNFILCNNCYAYNPAGSGSDDTERSSPLTDPAPPSNDAAAKKVDEGEGGDVASYGASIVGTVTGIIARLLNIFIALQIDVIMSQLTSGTENSEFVFFFTIERCVFNRVPLFNIDYFNTDPTYEVGDLEIDANTANIEIKKGITDVYFICRTLALTIGLLVLIYIGIRMAISTVASEQAKYKKMLVSWVESTILIFAMPYIISAVITFGSVITGVFYNIEQDLLGENIAGTDSEYGVFEETIRDVTVLSLFEKSGLDLTLWSIIYWCLLFLEMKFLWQYAKRFLMVGFLIIISPLITITYSIDKVGDGKAQAFSIWFKEFTVNILIQPLHALIYTIFVLTANAIAKTSPLVALALLMAIGAVERMVKVVFDMKGLVTLRGIDKFMKKEG